METNVVHQGDCLEVIADFPDNSIDTIITDPPYGLSDDSGASLEDSFLNIFFDVVFPDFYDAYVKSGANIKFSGPFRSVMFLNFMDRSIWEKPGIRVPECTVDLNPDVMSGNKEIKDSSKSSVGVSDLVLGDSLDFKDKELIFDYFLNLRPSVEFSFSNRLSCGFRQLDAGCFSMPVVIFHNSDFARFLCSLTPTNSSFFSDVIGFCNSPESEAKRSPLVVAGSGTEIIVILSFDLGRGTIEIIPTNRADHFDFLFEFASSQLIRTNSTTSSLSSKFKASQFSFVSDTTDGAISLYLHKDIITQIKKSRKGFMGKNWDHGIPGVVYWEEMLRVAKPGATLMAFGGTRTHHRLMVAIEDAGWEIRDCMMWLYAQGFPKSLSVSKAIDKAEGVEPEVIGIVSNNTEYIASGGFKGGNYANSKKEGSMTKNDQSENANLITAPSTPLAKQFDGYGTALKPAYEIIVVAQAPIEKNYAYNAEKWGVAGLNIDGGRVGYNVGDDYGRSPNRADGTRSRSRGHSFGEGLKEDIGMPHVKGRFPANLILSHSEGCVRRGVKRVKGTGRNSNQSGPGGYGGQFGGSRDSNHYADPDGYETTEDWDCEPDCAVRLLDEQGGELKSGEKKPGGVRTVSVAMGKMLSERTGYFGANKGGASRFFKNFPPARFIYSGKAGKKERNIGLERMEKKVNHSAYGEFEGTPEHVSNDGSPRANFHPTVKPLKVLEYLCTLTRTPTGGIILDPFAGSGTTALAAIATDRPYILIEKEAEYVEITEQRIAGYTAETIYLSEVEEEAGQLTLW